MTIEDRNGRTLMIGRPDWNRETPRSFWDPSRKLLLSVRRYQYWKAKRGGFSLIVCKFLVMRHRFWSVVTGADIPLNCQIGGGLIMLHPNGIVIHPKATIGENCLIFQQVTVGTAGPSGTPVIGNNVEIGAGAKVLGDIQVGTGAKIGANSVVLSDVPSNATFVGIPARQLS